VARKPRWLWIAASIACYGILKPCTHPASRGARSQAAVDVGFVYMSALPLMMRALVAAEAKATCVTTVTYLAATSTHAAGVPLKHSILRVTLFVAIAPEAYIVFIFSS
jgi:hypothetical protein